MITKGIILARRETCRYLTKTYEKMLKDILNMKSIIEVFNIIIDSIVKLLANEVPPRDNLTMITTLGGNYKSDSYFMKVFSDELRRIGKNPAPGERLEYIIVKTNEEVNDKKFKQKLGLKMREIETYEETLAIEKAKKEGKELLEDEEFKISNDLIFEDEEDDPLKVKNIATSFYPPEQIDAFYYINNKMTSSLDQLFETGYKKELEKYVAADVTYKPKFSRLHPVSIIHPVQLISQILKDYTREYDISTLSPIIDSLKEQFKKVTELLEN